MGGIHPEVYPPGLWNLERPHDPTAGVALVFLSVLLLVGSAYSLDHVLGPRPRPPLAFAPRDASPPAPAVWGVDVLVVVFWSVCTVCRQPAQWRRSEFVDRLRQGDLRETIRDLASRRPEEFPPTWDPARALARDDFAARMLEAVQLAADLPAHSWVRRHLLNRFGDMLSLWLDPLELWMEQNAVMNEEQFQQLTVLRDLLRRLPEGPAILEPYGEYYLKELSDAVGGRDSRRAAILQDLLAQSFKRGSTR
jgi:hypothetical protein